MLPSKGYFSGFPCVFYSDGDCQRPHCHYRHSLNDRKINSNTDIGEKCTARSGNSTVTPEQLSVFTKLVEKAVDQVLQSDPESVNKTDRSALVRNALDQVLADPEAVRLVSSKQKKVRSRNPPSYQPTPISKLNQIHIPVMSVQEKPILAPRKMINPSENDTVQDWSSVLIRSTLGALNGIGSHEKYPRSLENMNSYPPSRLANDGKPQPGYAGGLEHGDRHGCLENVPVFNENRKPFLNSVGYNVVAGNEYRPTERNNAARTDQGCKITNSPSFISDSEPLGATDLTKSRTFDSSKSAEFIQERNAKDTPRRCVSSKKHEMKCQISLPKLYDVILNEADRDTNVERPESPCYAKRRKTDVNTVIPQRAKQVERGIAATTDAEYLAAWPELTTQQNIRGMNSKKGTKNADKNYQREADAIRIERQGLTAVSPPENISTSGRRTTMEDVEIEKRSATGRVDSRKPKMNVERPPEKRRKTEILNMKVTTSGQDPFTRWLQNKKVRQILGKPDPQKSFLPQIKRKTLPHVDDPVPQLESPNEDLPMPKTTKRIAHNKDSLRPTPIQGENIIVPVGFRQYFCNAFFDEFKKKMSPETARSRAAHKELAIAKQSKLTRTYKNNCTLMLVKYRKGDCDTSDGKVAKSSDLKLTPASCPDFTYGWTLHKCFSKYLLSESQLRENGFPMALNGKPECAYIDKASRRYSNEQPSDKPFCRLCANCSKEFEIDSKGMPLTKNDCFYHWGKLRKTRFMGQWQDIFTCCDGMVDSTPCESSQYHVWSGRNEDCLTGYVQTPKLPTYMEEYDAGIYALDCEMCYTTNGLELARLTVIDVNERVIFDQVVSLNNPVLNYCTRFSGIDADQIAKATYSFEDVRRWVLDHFFDKTILVGHSLESDLKALKVIHKTIVDTSVTFPHQFGPPHKLSLKHLASSILEIVIQENENGHDSKEDAATCLKLMMKKIKEDSKIRKPRVFIQYNAKKS